MGRFRGWTEQEVARRVQASGPGCLLDDERPSPLSIRKSKSKYNAKRVECDGQRFDSQLEARRYGELKTLADMGVIRDLRLQVPYVLMPSFRESTTNRQVRAIRYIADFVYREEINGTWREVIEDAKGVETQAFRIKWRLLRYVLRDQDVVLKLYRGRP